MYYSNVSKSEALNAKDIMKNSEEVLEEVRLHGVYTAFSVNFETGEVQYVSPSFNFKINKETGELEAEGKVYDFHPEVIRLFDEWLENNNSSISALQSASATHTTDIASLKSTTSGHTGLINTISSNVRTLQTEVLPPERGGTGCKSIKEFLDGADMGEYIESYQKPWNVDENVGSICVYKVPDFVGNRVIGFSGSLEYGEVQISFIAINSGTVELCYSLSSSVGWPSKPSSGWWYHVRYFVNNEQRYHYQSSSATLTPIEEGSKNLEVKKGDTITFKLSAEFITKPETVNSVTQTLDELYLRANMETPYTYIRIGNK